MSCYTLPIGFRLPWPPPCCLNELTPFLFIVNNHLAPYLDLRFIPYRQICLPNMAHWKNSFTQSFNKLNVVHSYSKFEDRPRDMSLPPPLIINFTKNNWLFFSYPEGNFGGNQLLDGSISLSPLNPSLTNDLHVSIATNFHQGFPWLHSTQA